MARTDIARIAAKRILLASFGGFADADGMVTPPPIVTELKALLARRKDLEAALIAAIKTANLSHSTNLPEIKDLPSFYDFIAASVVQIPRNSNRMLELDLAYYYILGVSPDEILKTDPEFKSWNVDFVNAWARFLDSEASIGGIDSYVKDPSFEIDDYQRGPSGWRSFNQFFARQVKPGKRPASGLCDDSVVVSPCDFVINDVDAISEESTISAKGHTFPIAELLAGSDHATAFHGGSYLSGTLQIYNYHRFHAPVRGKVVESRKIPGIVGLTIEKQGDMLVPVPKPGFQFTQDRGLVVIDSPAVGLVAMVPVGMAQISSVVLTAEPCVDLYKGEECGYFQFGGSDVVILTQKGAFDIDPSVVGNPVNQGVPIGTGRRPALA